MALHKFSALHLAGVLTFAAWNVEWLFDGIDDPLPVPPLDAAKVSSKIKAVAAVLQELGADIIHLAEVENCAILGSVAERLNDSYHPLMISGTDTYLRQQVALLTRVSPMSLTRSAERVEVGSEGGSTGLSKHLIADFSIAGRQFQILGLHLKARPHQKDACAKREGQARIAQSIVRKALQMGKDVIVLGDFNDFDSEVPGPNGEAPMSTVLRMLKDVDNDGHPDLWNALTRVPVSERYSSWYDRNHDGKFQYRTERSLIDHVLVSNSLKDGLVDAGILHTHDPTIVSDHWPLWIRINLEALGNRSEEINPSRKLMPGPSRLQTWKISASWAWGISASCVVFLILCISRFRARQRQNSVENGWISGANILQAGFSMFFLSQGILKAFDQHVSGRNLLGASYSCSAFRSEQYGVQLNSIFIDGAKHVQ